MSDLIIDPSEIIIDKSGAVKEDVFHANPWIRFLARFFDYAWFFLLLWGARFLFHNTVPFARFESFVPVEFFAWIPLEAAFLATWGTTPGKFFLKIKMRQGRRFKFPFPIGIKRAFNVWLRGLGMMIPVINVLCLLVAYHRLKTFQATTWDREENIHVTHSPIGKWRIGVAALFSASVFFLYFNAKNFS